MVLLDDHVDHGRNLVALESCVAELADAQFERLGFLRNERGDLGCDELTGDRVRHAAHRDVLDVVDLQQNVLDLGRVHFLAADIDQLRLASENTNVLAIGFDQILRVEPAVSLEWRRRVEIAQHRARRSDPEHAGNDLVLKAGPELEPD